MDPEDEGISLEYGKIITTIGLHKSTVERLEMFKALGESYDKLIVRLLDTIYANTGDMDMVLFYRVFGTVVKIDDNPEIIDINPIPEEGIPEEGIPRKDLDDCYPTLSSRKYDKGKLTCFNTKMNLTPTIFDVMSRKAARTGIDTYFREKKKQVCLMREVVKHPEINTDFDDYESIGMR